MNNYTIADFNKQFPDGAACLEWLKNYLYPDGVFCPQYQMVTNHSRITKRLACSCNRCGKHTYPMTGTILECSRTPLRQWFFAVFLMSTTRCAISAKQLQPALGVTCKTSWLVFCFRSKTCYLPRPHTTPVICSLDTTL